MKRLPEAVTIKVSELFAALHSATDDLKMAGAEASLTGDFSQVAEAIAACRKLQALEADIKAAVNVFQTQYTAHPAEKTSHHKRDKKITRKHDGKHLRVSVAGQIIEESTIKDTFVKTLKVLGLERVAKLNKTVAKTPLVSKIKANGYQSQRQCDGWHVTTHISKVTAKMLLEDIAKALNVPLKVECIAR